MDNSVVTAERQSREGYRVINGDGWRRDLE